MREQRNTRRGQALRGNQGDPGVLCYGLDLPVPQPVSGLRAKLWSSQGQYHRLGSQL
jgi:hypothetical protein